MAFGIAYLDCAHIRGAKGLSGKGALPIAAEFAGHLCKKLVLHGEGELLLPPQSATATDNVSIRANHAIFCMKTSFAETVNETDRPCPQLDDWLFPAEADASGRTSSSCF